MYLSDLIRWFEEGHAPAQLLAQSEEQRTVWFELLCDRPDLFNKVAASQPQTLANKFTCSVPIRDKPLAHVFPGSSWEASKTLLNVVAALDCHGLAVAGAAIARELVVLRDEPHDPRSPQLIEHLCKDSQVPPAAHLLHDAAQLWMALYCLHKTDGYDSASNIARTSLEDTVVRLADRTPETWADSLRFLLHDSSAFGDLVEAVTIPLAQTSVEVRRALLHISERVEEQRQREHARGLLLLAESADQPKPDTVGRLVDIVARWATSGAIFPHPLSPTSATWLTSKDAEGDIRAGLRKGLCAFRDHFALQGGENERTLCGTLLAELEQPFRDRRPVIAALARVGIAPRPIVAIKHRSLTDCEEKRYGPDVAILVTGSIPGSHTLDIVEFVQLKKPRQYRSKWIDRWRINTQQLKDLMSTSQSSVYWLIDPSGEVCVVPAKVIKAYMPRNAGKTFTVGFNALRSVAISVEQFLAELLVGGWLGSDADKTRAIARGEVPGLVPKHLVEIDVRIGQQG